MPSNEDPLAEAKHCIVARAYAEAEALCRTALATRPDDADALNTLGAALVGLQRIDEALDVLRPLVSRGGDNIEAWYNYAMALYLSGNPDEALNYFRALLAANPKYALAHFRIGLIHHQRGDFERASTCYRRALGLDPALGVVQDCLDSAQARLFFGSGAGFQGAHAPQRQVFLSAAVHSMRDATPPLRILEIGSYMGSSALTLAHAIHGLTGKPGSILCIDPWLPAQKYITQEMNLMLGHHDGAYQAFLRNIATAPPSVTIDHRRGDSHEIMPTLDEASFDIVYIDGSHHYPDVLADIRDAMRVLRAGGLVAGDDLELQGHECDIAHARGHISLDTTVDPKTGILFHPGVTLAVAETFGPVSAYDGFWIMRKSESGYATVELGGCEGNLPLHWPKAAVHQLRERFRASGELRRVHG